MHKAPGETNVTSATTSSMIKPGGTDATLTPKVNVADPRSPQSTLVDKISYMWRVHKVVDAHAV